MVRAHALRKLEAQTALMAGLVLVSIVTAWVDAWLSLQSVTVDLAGLGPPVLLAICYYLAAAVVFPHREADHERLADYYSDRRPFIAGMLLMADVFDDVSYRQFYVWNLHHQPPVFWLWLVPYNIVIGCLLVALLFVRSRRANIVLIAASILLLVIPYLENGAVRDAIAHHYGYG